MLTILRQDTKIAIQIKDGILDDGTVYSLTFECGNKYYAELLARHIDSKLDKLIQDIRAEEYNKVWDDHRKRQPKKNWFSPLLKLFQS